MPMDMDYTRQVAEDISSRTGKTNHRDIINYSYRTGTNRGRFMPPWPGCGDLAMAVWHHFSCPPGKTHHFCWENIFPNRGVNCPVCVVVRDLEARNIDGVWRQRAVNIPRTNWIDRQPVSQYGAPMDATQNPGPQIIDLKTAVYNYFMSTAAQTGCDLTSLDLGYDVIIGYDGSKQLNPGVVPGAATPLHPDPEVAKRWIEQAYDLRNIIKMPNWSSEKGREEWAKLNASARELFKFYTNQATQVAVGSPGAPGQSSYANGAPAPQFTQPSYQAPVAPAPAYGQSPPAYGQTPPAYQQQAYPQAPPPMYAQPVQPIMAPPPPPQAPMPMNPGMLGSPGQVPFGASSATIIAPVAMPPAPPPPPPAMAVPSAPVAPPAAPAVERSPWESPAVPPVPQMPSPPMPPTPPAPAPQASAPPPPPPPVTAPPVAPPAPVSINSTSMDGKPPCFGHSRLDQTVVWQDVKGGWSDIVPEVGYRCLRCSHALECEGKARAQYPQDYVKDAQGKYPTVA